MKVSEKSFVTIDYLIRLKNGQTFPQDGTPETISFCLGHGIMPPAFEEAMIGMEANEGKSVHLSPEEAYGEVDEELITEVDRADFEGQEDLRPGLVFETMDEENHPVYFVVSEVKPDAVVIDFNHPLAGKEVDIDFTVKHVREATEADLKGQCSCSSCQS
ncbi:MAG: peptidylprolyl isomerase [Deltaproteobacteria bacterium]|nr:peptidylprolyl isomerase [Deltaproteobacteria bacterium]